MVTFRGYHTGKPVCIHTEEQLAATVRNPLLPYTTQDATDGSHRCTCSERSQSGKGLQHKAPMQKFIKFKPRQTWSAVLGVSRGKIPLGEGVRRGWGGGGGCSRAAVESTPRCGYTGALTVRTQKVILTCGIFV